MESIHSLFVLVIYKVWKGTYTVLLMTKSVTVTRIKPVTDRQAYQEARISIGFITSFDERSLHSSDLLQLFEYEFAMIQPQYTECVIYYDHVTGRSVEYHPIQHLCCNSDISCFVEPTF